MLALSQCTQILNGALCKLLRVFLPAGDLQPQTPCPAHRHSFWRSQFRSTLLELKVLKQLSSLSQLLLSAAASYDKPPFLDSVPCKRKTLTVIYIYILSKPLLAFSDPTSLLHHFQLHSSALNQLNIVREAEAPYDRSQPTVVIEL